MTTITFTGPSGAMDLIQAAEFWQDRSNEIEAGRLTAAAKIVSHGYTVHVDADLIPMEVLEGDGAGP